MNLSMSIPMMINGITTFIDTAQKAGKVLPKLGAKIIELAVAKKAQAGANATVAATSVAATAAEEGETVATMSLAGAT